MIRELLAGAVLLASAAVAFADGPAASAPAGHQVGEEAAVLAAMDRYVTAISTSGLEAMAAMQTPDGMTYSAMQPTFDQQDRKP